MMSSLNNFSPQFCEYDQLISKYTNMFVVELSSEIHTFNSSLIWITNRN